MTYTEQLQKIVADYRSAGQQWPATSSEMAAWAISEGKWHPQHGAMIKKCAEELSGAMREEYVTDPQGRRVRAKHVARFGEGSAQVPLWEDIRSASREHMETAFQQRRQQILGDCKQLKTDVDSYKRQLQLVDPYPNDLRFYGRLRGDRVAEASGTGRGLAYLPQSPLSQSERHSG